MSLFDILKYSVPDTVDFFSEPNSINHIPVEIMIDWANLVYEYCNHKEKFTIEEMEKCPKINRNMSINDRITDYVLFYSDTYRLIDSALRQDDKIREFLIVAIKNYEPV